MTNYYSVTYTGLITHIVGWFFTALQIEVLPGDLDIFVKVLWLILTGLLGFWGRYRQGDINLLGFKKRDIGPIDTY